MEHKRIVIVGGGLVGRTLAERLSKDEHDVTLIESDADKVERLGTEIDAQVIHGNGATVGVLAEAGVDGAELVVASTDCDEVNLLVGLLAAHRFHVPRLVVRVHDRGHEDSFALFPADGDVEHVWVNPEEAAVERISTLLDVPGAIDVMEFMGGALLVAGFRMEHASEFAGLHVSDLKLLFASTPTLAVAIQRGVRWIIPHGEEEIRAGDLVYFAISRDDVKDMVALVGGSRQRDGRVLIAGATRIGLALARRLQEQDRSVVVIEEKQELANRAADELADLVLVQGRPTDRDLLEDEEIDRCSTFVAATHNHETNLVAGLLAKRLGAARAFVLVDNPGLVAMVNEAGIDAIISPRSLTIGLTLQHVRGGGVRAGAALLEDQVEIVEIEAQARSPLVSAPLSELKLPRGVLVAAVRRADGRIVVPRGDDRVEPGDRAVVVTTTAFAPRLDELLQPAG